MLSKNYDTFMKILWEVADEHGVFDTEAFDWYDEEIKQKICEHFDVSDPFEVEGFDEFMMI